MCMHQGHIKIYQQMSYRMQVNIGYIGLSTTGMQINIIPSKQINIYISAT